VSASAPTRRRILAGRARAFVALLAKPGDAALVGRMLAWQLCLPILKYLLPLPGLVRLMYSPARSTSRQPSRERRIASVTAWLYRSPAATVAGDNCLERSLIAYRYLGREGADPTLVVGMRRGPGEDVEGHVWVTVAGEPVTDTRAALEPFSPVVSFGSGGRARSAKTS
jgi:Transglutaminase-like superfamily